MSEVKILIIETKMRHEQGKASDPVIFKAKYYSNA